MQILGIDVGGSGIKAAVVDVGLGELATERERIETPRPATPEAVAEVAAQLVTHFDWSGPIGCGVPGVVKRGVMKTAANLGDAFVGRDLAALLSARTGCETHLLNDADAAGLAEVRFGAGRGCAGTVLVVTLGTGIGTAMFVDGRLVPNTELGHVEIDGVDAETIAAASAREREDLSWKAWSKRLDRYLRAVAFYVWPERIILGGGVSKKHDKFLHLLTVDCEVVPAELKNDAGIVGAALAGAEACVAQDSAEVGRAG